MVKADEGKHQTLVNLVADVLRTQGKEVRTNVLYNKGELDVLCDGIYYEIKCNYTNSNAKKAYSQIVRAINHDMCHYGYMVCYDGVYDILDENDSQVDLSELEHMLLNPK